ncbi:MAG TPA: diguanylate cyclase, partial [Burkholderiaceae bacterium]|nr:diguanylate cyclase [Burkholderiaceae bacterium]
MPTQSLRLLLTALALLCGAMLAVGVALGHGPDRPSAAGTAAVVGVALALALAVRLVALKRLSSLLAQQEVEHQAESLRFHTAINNMSQGLCFFDGQQRLIVCNQRYAEMYRLSIEQVRPGTTLRDIVDHRYASGCMPKMTREAYLAWRDSIAVADKPSNTVSTLQDGRTIAIHHRPMPDGGWVATHDDITEHREALAEIEHMARHDVLTGMPNRVLLHDRLTSAMHDARHPTAVLCLDLDRFKAVNDTFGHPAGDALLRLVAQRLTDCVRDGDVVARLGGDEFAIIQHGGEQPTASESLASRLVQAIAQPFDVAGQSVSIGTSVGIALSSIDCADPDDLLKRADLALYEAKSLGRGTHCHFRPELDRRARGRRELEADLRQAVEAGAFELHYQPLIMLPDQRIVAFEALLRWRHPRRGMVTPDDFIPLAEEVGLIDVLGRWVLHEACKQAATWPAHIGLAVNLSPLQLNSGQLVDTVRAALEQAGLARQKWPELVREV